MEQPTFDELKLTFTQKGNCLNGEVETLEVICRSDLPDLTKGYFIELKTECWSIDNATELVDLLNKVDSMIQTNSKTIIPNKKK